jgi:hypothetical protein
MRGFGSNPVTIIVVVLLGLLAFRLLRTVGRAQSGSIFANARLLIILAAVAIIAVAFFRRR